MDTVLTRIDVKTGDITAMSVEAIVNAANQTLLGGSGVDGAIHRAAGKRLLEHNRELGGCAIGQARITPSFDLAAGPIKQIIHTVGPVWHGAPQLDVGANSADGLLASCYEQCLKLAEATNVAQLAFPAISTGVYRFPKLRAATIAVDRTVAWLKGHEQPGRVIFCCFRDADAQIYRQVIAGYAATG